MTRAEELAQPFANCFRNLPEDQKEVLKEQICVVLRAYCSEFREKVRQAILKEIDSHTHEASPNLRLGLRIAENIVRLTDEP